MPRTTISFDAEQHSWIAEQADALDRSQSEIVRAAIDVLRGEEGPVGRQLRDSGDTFTVKSGESPTNPVKSDENLRETVAELAGRVDDLEAAVRADRGGGVDADGGETAVSRGAQAASNARDAEAGEASEDTDDGGDNALAAALKGWSYGRNEQEREASATIARRALAWLREHGDAARKSDVPLEELAADDPVGRTPDTLWSQVVRDSWQHAKERGYVEKPKYRAYRWVGGD